MPETLLTVTEAAERCNVSRDVIRGHIASGQLTASNVGLGSQRPCWRISPEALQAFLDLRTPQKRATTRRHKRRGPVTEFF